MNAFPDWFRHLYDSTGINFSIFYDPYDWGRYLSGVEMTVFLSLVTIVASVVLGAVGALIQSGPSKPSRALVNGFVVAFRNTPPLVQIFFFYFGIGALLPTVQSVSGSRAPLLSNTQWAIVTLSLFAAAFNIEIFRSGIEAVPKTTLEAAEALGYTRPRAYVHVVLPLAVRICLPALNNNLVNLLKTTTLAYAIAVPETLYEIKQIWSESQNVSEMMVVLLVTYGILVGAFLWIMDRWERSMRIPGYGR